MEKNYLGCTRGSSMYAWWGPPLSPFLLSLYSGDELWEGIKIQTNLVVLTFYLETTPRYHTSRYGKLKPLASATCAVLEHTER